MSYPITLISFGHLHLPTGPDGRPVPPDAEHVEDVQERFRDPACVQGLLDADGHDPRVRAAVLGTDGVEEWLVEIVSVVESLPAGQPRRIATGCVGRHRAPALTVELAARLRRRGHHVLVEHHHVGLPRVLR